MTAVALNSGSLRRGKWSGIELLRTICPGPAALEP
jgi:hypothetical protein